MIEKNYLAQKPIHCGMQGEGMAIMVEDKLLRRRDSALIEEDVGKENAELTNQNNGNLCLIFFWPVGG